MWFRGGHAELSAEAMSRLYKRTDDLPRWIAIETDGGELEKNRVDPAVNVVLYDDAAMIDDRNDYFFDTMTEALAFCAHQYSVAPEAWLDLGRWHEPDRDRGAAGDPEA